jgi:hypothetical protein
MENKVCTPRGCIPLKDYVMPLTGNSKDKCSFARAIMHKMLDYIREESGMPTDEELQGEELDDDWYEDSHGDWGYGYSDCQSAAWNAFDKILKDIGCEEKED